MDQQSHTTSLQRLQNVEKRIVRVLELAGGVMDELASPSGLRKELVSSHCNEFMEMVKVTLREEIKSACEYRPFEKCDYVPRISNEISCKKLEYVIAQLDEMKQTIDEYGGVEYMSGSAINYLTSVLALSKWLTQVARESIKPITYTMVTSRIYSMWDVIGANNTSKLLSWSKLYSRGAFILRDIINPMDRTIRGI